MRLFFVLALFLGVLAPGSARAEGRCVIVVPQQGNESLVNVCDTCRMVQVSRARSAGGIQGKRTYAVPARTKVDLTFNSPGKTRIHTDKPCRKESGPLPYGDAGQTRSSITCVQLARLKTGQPALINSCPACREVTLEYEIRNVGQKHQTETVNGRAVAVLTPHPEATDVRIRGEKTCALRR